MDSHLEEVSIAAARQNLPALVHEVERAGAVQLTRRGLPVAVLMSQQEYTRLTGRRLSLWGAIEKWSTERDPSVSLDDVEFPRDYGPARDFEWPE